MGKIRVIIEYGLYLLVFLLPIQTRWIIKAGNLNSGYWEYGTLSLYGTDILLIILIVLYSFLNIKKDKSFNFHLLSEDKRLSFFNIWWLIAGLELIMFIPIFFASNKAVAVASYGRFLLGIGLFWLVSSFNYSKTKLIISFVIGVSLQAILGLWQFLSQSSFSNKWLGMAEHITSDLGVSVIETLKGERWLRAYGGLDHPNILGGLLVIGVILLILQIINFKKRNSNGYKNNVVYAFFILIFTACLFFTFSRGAWAGLIVGLISLLVISVWQSDLLIQKRLLLIILVLGLLVFSLYTINSDLVLTRLSKDTRLEIKSNTERISSYKTAGEIVKKHWLTGVGIGNYTGAVHNIRPNLESYNYQPVHNVFMLILAEIGFIGLFVFIMIIFKVVHSLFSLKSIEYKFKIYNISFILVLLTMYMVDHWWWSLHFGILLTWLILGWVVKIGSTYEN